MTRMANSAPPGSLFKAPPPKRDERYLAAIRLLPCLICRATPCREAAHLRIGFHMMARKPSDWRTVPLCHRHHMRQHDVGEVPFWENAEIDPLAVIEELNRAYPDQDMMTAIILRQA